MTIKVGCIVEGHGEVEAVPVLIRKEENIVYLTDFTDKMEDSTCKTNQMSFLF